MRAIPPDLAAHLAGRATTLATCWQLTRTDGVTLGFTDHDRDLVFGGVTHAAGSGFEAADVDAELGFAVSGGEVTGALNAPSLVEADIEAGLYDGALVTTWLVNWADVAQRLQTASARIGEIRRSDKAFTVELRSAMQALNQTQGRLFARACDADLGDRRCTVDLARAAFRGAGIVTAADGRTGLSASGLADFPAGRFRGGLLTWTSGDNFGRTVEIRSHDLSAGLAMLDLWRPTVEVIAVGDAFTVTAGCDKSFATCRDVFANTLNFRGFPHIPGNDRALSVARSGSSNKGRSLSR